MRQRGFLKGREIAVRFAEEDELMRRMFPAWTPDEEENKCKVYLKRDEINAILMVCKNYKVRRAPGSKHPAHPSSIATATLFAQVCRSPVRNDHFHDRPYPLDAK